MPHRDEPLLSTPLMDYLQRILHDKLIPHAKTGASERIIVAQPEMDAATIPSGVKLAYPKIPGSGFVDGWHSGYAKAMSIPNMS